MNEYIRQMMNFSRLSKYIFPIITILILGGFTIAEAQQQLTFEDVMKFEELRNPVMSANGQWVGYDVWPERGDGEAIFQTVDGSVTYQIERGENPVLTHDGRWGAVRIQPPFLEQENAGNDVPKTGLTLLNTSDGEEQSYENVRRYQFTNDSEWLIVHHHRPDELDEHARENSQLGSPVRLVQLGEEFEIELDFVNESAADSTASFFVYGVVDTSGQENGLYAVDLNDAQPSPERIRGGENLYYNNLSWNHKTGRIAFTESKLDEDDDYRSGDASVWIWDVMDADPEEAVTPNDIDETYRLRANNVLAWSRDGERLFYAVMLNEMVRLDELDEEEDSLTAENMYDLNMILGDVESDVWHWDDPQIKTHEKQTWSSRKNHLYRAVYHLDEERSVQLAREDLPGVFPADNPNVVMGFSDLPYQKLMTWDGRYSDFYLIDLDTGEEKRILEKHRSWAYLSEGGNYLTWFDGKDWHLYDIEEEVSRNLTKDLDVPFENEDNDRPQPSTGYGVAGWVDGDAAVLIRDKYDIWQFDTQTGDPRNLTNGRDRERIYRIIDLEPERDIFRPRQRLLFSMFHDKNKNYGFYQGNVGRSGVSRLLEDDLKYSFLGKAEQGDQILFTVEKYDMFPNLWVAEDSRFRNVDQLTYLHEDLNEKFAWGQAELIDWYNVDGKKVQGILIYPGDYEEDKRYPVMIYYYERFSQRLHDFNHPYTNHRPVLAQYASDGYAVFLPDIWFDVPIPGYSATKNLVPGVHKLIEMGVADPDAIGLHGHSWSGYLTAHVITQTDIFAAAVAGAPVSNMTSAYSGIRWGSGLARQFQYERTQSRLGVSMWENLAPYIENSPVFFADRINTPLMLQFGDADGAVPWYQGIELYLALRRLGKPSVFLQYHNEPHHLGKFANRLDYAIKMKEYFDHYLKGEPAPAWITDGVPYRGE